ncbi:Uma2 family endonuclease [Myxococcus stipitatus]|uniref:Uma2 family endonuclease n=1 Tax=Myxococcus stipitatus TaxID=83455 RepID=UPI001F3210AC|nr:Uma2 family endonuclease [Myxococcus stipitatus]MCE9668435.1 Uma2 family endonuclease [Myxococcus stipitatus]
MTEGIIHLANNSLLTSLPSGWVGEVLDEELVASPRATPAQTRAAFMLGVELGEQLDRRRGGSGRWCFLRAPELRLGHDVLVPDLAGWRRERVDGPLDPDVPFLTLAPDWVCEVLSPSTAALDRTRKLPLYARQGVGHVWLVDPVARTLETYQRVKRGWLLTGAYESDALVRADPFSSTTLELDSLWLSEDADSLLSAVP